MFGNYRRWPLAMAGGLIALAILMGCGRDQSVASKSAAAFREAQKKGETFEGTAHGHGSMTPGGGGHEMPDDAPEDGSAAGHSGMAMEGMDHSGMAMGGAKPAGKAQGRADHSGHSGMPQEGMDHSGMAMGGAKPAGKAQGGADHSGHSGMAQEAMDHSGMAMGGAKPAGKAQGGADHSGHSGMAMGGTNPSIGPTAVAASPGQPAETLSADALDAPAATSMADAQRSAEMAEEMSGGGGHGGHGGHGTGTYRQTDAGRGPDANEGSEEQPPGHQGHEHGGAQDEDENEAAAAYVCPMHPEVTSATPGKCPKCGMDLVKRRQG